MTTVTVRNLLAMPGPERRAEIEALIMAEFRAVLRVEPGEPLGTDTPYFELGVTSLQLVEARKRLEGLLGVTISSNVMFNQPTLAQLTAYLAEEVLPGAVSPPGSADSPDQWAGQGPDADELALLSTVMPELDQA